MKNVTTLILMILAGVACTACQLNNVRTLSNIEVPSDDRTTIVYGIRVDGPWAHQKFGVNLDEYDLNQQNISGNCFRFNRMEASVDSSAREMRYFEFDAKPGYYVYSVFNGAQLRDKNMASRAFVAPQRAVVYVGDFILGPDGKVEFEQEAPRAQRALTPSGAQVEKFGIAQLVEVRSPKPFVCTP